MRRTITSLMFLAVSGLAFAVHAADRGASQYYAASSGSIRISDEEGDAAQEAASPATVRPQSAEQHALYVHNGDVGAGIQRTNYFDSSCGCSTTNGGCNIGYDCDCCPTNLFRFEYLTWWSRGRNIPPLVTTGTVNDPTATVLYGNDPVGENIRNGGRLTLSHLFADGITYADVRFWGVEDSSETFNITGANNPLIAIPFFDAAPNVLQPNALLITAPGVATAGSVNILSKNDLIGADAWVRRNWSNDCCGSLDLFAGYQFSRLDDSIVINTSTTSLVSVPAGTTFTTTDNFRTQNEFHGATVGVLGQSRRGVWTIEGLAKLGLGNMRQQVAISGSNTANGVAGPGIGGFFTQASNVGTFERNRAAFVPEINLNLVYNLSQQWRIVGGYSFIYWSSVVLAGNQIDTAIDTRQLAGIPGAQPAFNFQRTDFWVQGINLGAEYRW